MQKFNNEGGLKNKIFCGDAARGVDMEKIQELRNRIDEIDDSLASLFNERMRVAKEIGEEKAKAHANVTDYGREKEIINRVCKRVDEDKIVYAKQTFDVLFDVSKAYQTQFAEVESELGKKIDLALKNTQEDFPVSATVACQGIMGAYSMLACERLFKVSDVLYFKDWKGVFNAIEKGLCKYGILPIENSTAGSVNPVYDLILSHKFYIVRTLKMKIRHSLLAKKGTSLNNITEIISHEQAINQCSEFIKKFPNAKITVVENTAVAARMVSESDRTDIAAISSPECADIYGLTSLKSNIQNVDNNYTRFICIAKNLEIYQHSNKISIVMSLPHVTGSLNKILSKFSSLGLNLTKIESRPIAASDFEFAFYFDFEGDVRKKEVRNLLSELYNSLENFAFLGCYGEVR